jgi:hypothetical protein
MLIKNSIHQNLYENGAYTLSAEGAATAVHLPDLTALLFDADRNPALVFNAPFD